MQIDIYRKIVIISAIKSRYVTIDYGKTVTFIEILFHLSIKEKYIENCKEIPQNPHRNVSILFRVVKL